MEITIINTKTITEIKRLNKLNNTFDEIYKRRDKNNK